MSETKSGGGGRVTPGGGESGSGGSQPGGDAPADQPATSNERGPVRPDALDRDDNTSAGPRETELIARVAELESALDAAQQELARRDRRATLERELTDLGIVDLEIGVALTEAILDNGDEPDAERAASRLRVRKPFLFAEERPQGAGRRAPSAMAGAPGAPGAGRQADLEDMADGARATGDRRELLRYLRARRGM